MGFLPANVWEAEAQVAERGADGELHLSPKAMRQLGQSVLADIAERLTGRGERSTRLSGRLGEPTGASREWAFGDTEPWDVPRTITNAVLREAGAGGFVPGSGVAIDVGDVEITETEARSQAAVVLLVDDDLATIAQVKRHACASASTRLPSAWKSRSAS